MVMIRICIVAYRICRSPISLRITKLTTEAVTETEQGTTSMLTLVQRRPRMAEISWDNVIRFCRGARMAVAVWRARVRERQALAQLDDHLLADIGITREARIAECAKPFWHP
jgi:uncharacterized protein YjiS (DUF1127 family)